MLHSCYAHTCKHTFIISMSVLDMYICRCVCVRVCFYVMLNQKINMYLLGCDLDCRRWILYWTWMIHPDLWCWCQHLPKPCLQMLIFPQVCSNYGQQEFNVWSSTCYFATFLPSFVSLFLQTILLYRHRVLGRFAQSLNEWWRSVGWYPCCNRPSTAFVCCCWNSSNLIDFFLSPKKTFYRGSFLFPLLLTLCIIEIHVFLVFLGNAGNRD